MSLKIGIMKYIIVNPSKIRDDEKGVPVTRSQLKFI
jgi:hypothetical protein